MLAERIAGLTHVSRLDHVAPLLVQRKAQHLPQRGLVLDEQHRPSLEGRRGVVEQTHVSGRGGALAVAGGDQEVDVQREGDLAHEVGEEDERSLEQPDHQQAILGGVGPGDLLGERTHSRLHLLGAEHHAPEPAPPEPAVRGRDRRHPTPMVSVSPDPTRPTLSRGLPAAHATPASMRSMPSCAATARAVPSGGPSDGERIKVELVRRGGVWKVDSLRSNAPVFANESVLNKQSSEELEQWLENLKPEDFGKLD